jgi:putative ABC transport system ATP-binding protein/lipoprotein-releasing system ATP-binding protein
MSIQAIHVSKQLGSPSTQVLTDISFTIEKSEFVALTGKSGSGKSTLLYVLSSLDSASQGSVLVDNRELGKLSSKDLSLFRNQKVGFVFQFHYLIAELTALENVLLPARKLRQEVERTARAVDLLSSVGLASKLDRLPRQLSGGEQQRVAIARALIMEPEYLFADEPTGALDSANGNSVMQILAKTNREKGTTIVLVTHDPDFAKLAPRQIYLTDGKVVGDSKANWAL